MQQFLSHTDPSPAHIARKKKYCEIMRESEHDHFQGLHVLLCHSAVAAVHSLARFGIMHLRNAKLCSFFCALMNMLITKVGYRHTVIIIGNQEDCNRESHM